MKITQQSFDELQRRLKEAEDTLHAIRTGEVDGIVVSGPDGEKIYSLVSAEFPYRQLIEQMSEGVATLSPEGTILYCNHSFARMAGLPLENTIGNEIEVFIQASCRESFKTFIERSASGNLSGEFVLSTTSGACRHTLISFTRQEHLANTISIILSDLTERKEAEEALRRAHDHLEEKVQERTRELSDEIAMREVVENEVRKLNESLERRVTERTAEIEAANKELEAFSYTISHDLRAPLRAIRCFTTILQDTVSSKLTDEEHAHLKIIRDSAVELSIMIESLLEFSRIGRAGVRKHRVELEELVVAAVEIFRMEGHESTRVTMHPLLPAFGDRILLTSVMKNLLANAFKFSKKNPDAHIEVGCLPGDSETVYYVRDNGVGFDTQFAGKLFEVFEKLHPRDEYPGTGVGLAVARRIIQRHGGRIWAEAEPEKGATFFFSLPNETQMPGTGTLKAEEMDRKPNWSKN